MRRKHWLQCLSAIIIVVVFITGCSSEKSVISSSDSKLSTIDPSEMALQISDLPVGYIKINFNTISDVQNYQSMGTVKKGYQVGFSKGSTKSDIVFISQGIFVMPIDQIKQVLPNMSTQFNKMETKPDQLSNPDIGDSSLAFRVLDSQGSEMYIITFVKLDVLEFIAIGGTQTDYEVLKSIAKKAEAKIK